MDEKEKIIGVYEKSPDYMEGYSQGFLCALQMINGNNKRIVEEMKKHYMLPPLGFETKIVFDTLV